MTDTTSAAIRALSHDELLAKTRDLAEKERRISVAILHHLLEVDRRRAYAKLGYASLWDYALKELKYSEAAAFRRISAMRALKAHPELEKRIEDGALTVTAVSQVQSFLKAEREHANRTYSLEQKSELFRKCENKSTRDVTRELLTLSPLAVRVQKERVVTENRTVISFVADPDLLGKIHRVRDLSVARLRDPASYPELMGLMSEIALDEIDPLRKPVRRDASPAPQATDAIRHSRNIPESLRRRIWQEAAGRCQFVSSEGRRCESTFGLEVEHCKPYSMGGSSNDSANLRLLCKKHNQWQAIQSYGLEKMAPYLERD